MAAAPVASQPLFHAAQLSLTATGAAPQCGKQLLIVPKEWSGQMSRSAFHLRQVSVMFALRKWPCCSDPRVRLGEQSGHTSSISGDHRGCCAAWSREPSGWMDWNSSGYGCGGGAEGWQQLLCADITYPSESPPNPPTHRHCCLWITVSKSLTNQFWVDLWDHHPFIALLVAWALTCGPPSSLLPSVSLFVPCDLPKTCDQAAAEWNAQNTHRTEKSGRKETTHFHFFGDLNQKLVMSFLPRSLRTVY